MYDTIIVGAGPVGSHVAARLAGLGYKVIVFEEHSGAGEAVCCTGIVGKECLDTFPVDSEAVLRAEKSATLFSPSGIPLRVEKQEVQAYILDRGVFDSFLSTSAQEAGVDYLWGSRVRTILPGEESVRVEIENSSKSFEGKTAVIASGFHSRLTERVGLGRVRDFAAGAQVEVDAEGVDEVEIYFGKNVAPGFFGWLVPTSQGRARVGLLARRRPGKYLRALLDVLADQDRIAARDARIYYGGVPLRPLSRTYTDRVLVVGDAAGQVKPTTAGGIYYGLLCAENAVDTLHQALAVDSFEADTLSSYEKRWKERLGSELRASRWARWLLEHLSDERLDRTFKVVESKGIHTALLDSPEFSFDWHRGLILKALRLVGLRGMLRIMRPV